MLRLRSTTIVAKQGNSLLRQLYVEEATLDSTGRPIAWTLKSLSGFGARFQLFRPGAPAPVLAFQTVAEGIPQLTLVDPGQITLTLSAAQMNLLSGRYLWALELFSDDETLELPEDSAAQLFLLPQLLIVSVTPGDTLVTGAGDTVVTGAGDTVATGGGTPVGVPAVTVTGGGDTVTTGAGDTVVTG